MFKINMRKILIILALAFTLSSCSTLSEINETIKIVGESKSKPQLVRYVSEVY